MKISEFKTGYKLDLKISDIFKSPIFNQNKILEKEMIKLDAISIKYPKLEDDVFTAMKNIKPHKTIRDKYDVEHLNNGFLKYYEMLIGMPDIIDNITTKNKSNEINAFHNAELPGGFIMAQNQYNTTMRPDIKYSWNGCSLIGGEVPLGDDYGLYAKYPKNWIMNYNMNGDLFNNDNLIKMIDILKPKNINLCTSDLGMPLGFYFNNQEHYQFLAHLGQIIVALASLKKNGSIVMKQYTVNLTSSQSLLLLLCTCFDKFYCVKPLGSRPRNVEIYLVGIGYNPVSTTLITELLKFHKSQIGTRFMGVDKCLYNIFPEQFNIDLSNMYNNIFHYIYASIKQSNDTNNYNKMLEIRTKEGIKISEQILKIPFKKMDKTKWISSGYNSNKKYIPAKISPMNLNIGTTWEYKILFQNENSHKPFICPPHYIHEFRLYSRLRNIKSVECYGKLTAFEYIKFKDEDKKIRYKITSIISPQITFDNIIKIPNVKYFHYCSDQYQNTNLLLELWENLRSSKNETLFVYVEKFIKVQLYEKYKNVKFIDGIPEKFENLIYCPLSPEFGETLIQIYANKIKANILKQNNPPKVQYYHYYFTPLLNLDFI